jgi:hypothetical protein
MTQAAGYSTRTIKANGLAANGGLVRLAAGQVYVAVDVVAGSGLGHIATVDSCDCADRVYRGSICKHMRAARLAEGIACCSTCGARTCYEVHHVGGLGDCGFMICRQDRSHKSIRVE